MTPASFTLARTVWTVPREQPTVPATSRSVIPEAESLRITFAFSIVTLLIELLL